LNFDFGIHCLLFRNKFLFDQAGIDKDQLQIALEPEAASLFCKYVPIEKMAGSEKGFNVFSTGSTYIVLDAGGISKYIFQLP
jgi:hypothetical protein